MKIGRPVSSWLNRISKIQQNGNSKMEKNTKKAATAAFA